MTARVDGVRLKAWEEVQLKEIQGKTIEVSIGVVRDIVRRRGGMI